jgi:hypothetical protein
MIRLNNNRFDTFALNILWFYQSTATILLAILSGKKHQNHNHTRLKELAQLLL